MRKELLRLLVEKSFRCSEETPFTLASGKQSPYYIDCKQVTFCARGMFLIGELIFTMIREIDAVCIGGLTLGADPISVAVAYTSYLKGKPINAFSIRKQPKGHGTQKWIEGGLKKGSRVIVVEDVITTGGSTIKAIERLLYSSMKPVLVVALVDRQEENGVANIERLGIRVLSLFRLQELVLLHR